MFFFIYFPKTREGWVRLGQIVLAGVLVGFVAGTLYEGSAVGGVVGALVGAYLTAMFGSTWVRDQEKERIEREWNSSIRAAASEFVTAFLKAHGRVPTDEEMALARDEIVRAAERSYAHYRDLRSRNTSDL